MLGYLMNFRNIWHQREQFHLWNGEKGIILTQGPNKGIFLSLLINHHGIQIPLGHLSIYSEFLRLPQNVCPSEQIQSFSEEGEKIKEINYFQEKTEGQELKAEVVKIWGNIHINVWATVGQKSEF